MNYARIYSEFIADRLKKQPVKPVYFEKHHIVPRSLGGGDEKSNIIRLAPEDHLFAHLLLAKMHGGSMWNAVYAMCHLLNDSTKVRRIFGNRPIFGYMRRHVAQYHASIFKGPNGPQADKEVHELYHFDGRVAKGNRFDLNAQTGVTRQQISAVLRGAKKSAHGWYCKKHNPQGKTRSELLSESIRDTEIHTLYHYDGRVWGGSKVDFSKAFGTDLYFYTPTGSCAGWHRSKEDAAMYFIRRQEKCARNSAARGSISGANNPMFGADRRKPRYIKVIHKTGEVYEGCSLNFAVKIGIEKPADYQRLMKTLRGKKVVGGFVVKSFKGWEPVEVQA